MPKFKFVDFCAGQATSPNVSINPFAVAFIGENETSVVIELINGSKINLSKYNGEKLIVNDRAGVRSALELAMKEESWTDD